MISVKSVSSLHTILKTYIAKREITSKVKDVIILSKIPAVSHKNVYYLPDWDTWALNHIMWTMCSFSLISPNHKDIKLIECHTGMAEDTQFTTQFTTQFIYHVLYPLTAGPQVVQHNLYKLQSLLLILVVIVILPSFGQNLYHNNCSYAAVKVGRFNWIHSNLGLLFSSCIINDTFPHSGDAQCNDFQILCSLQYIKYCSCLSDGGTTGGLYQI